MSTFALIHGSWHDGSSWRRLIGPLRARGHAALAPDLPIDDPTAGWEERIEPVLLALREVRGEVVIVAHSGASGYGALVADRIDRPLLVYLCPRLTPFPAPPDAPRAFRPGFPFPQPGPDGSSAWERDAAIDALYPRLSRETAEELAETLRPTGPPAGDFPMRGHPDVAAALVYASEDELFEPDWERFMARELLGVEAIEIGGGHFPMAEDPESLAEALARLASEHGGPIRSTES